MINEKRKCRRIDLARPVLMQTDNGQNIELQCLNFSMDGIGVISNEKLEMGKRYFFTINIAQQGKVRMLNILGEVVYFRKIDIHFKVGLRFFDTELASARS